MLAGADMGFGYIADVDHRPGQLDGGKLASHELGGWVGRGEEGRRWRKEGR